MKIIVSLEIQIKYQQGELTNMNKDFAILVSSDGKFYDVVQENITLESANNIACQSTHWKIETYFNDKWEPLFSSEDL